MQPETVQLILSIVLAAATTAYTWINWKMLKESRIARQQKTAPLIIPYLKSTATGEALCLYIENVGEGCAKNLHIKVLRDYPCFCKDDCLLSRFPLFKEGINLFPSGYNLHFTLNWWDGIKVEKDEYIELELSYSDINDRVVESKRRYIVMFNQVRSGYLVPPETYEGQTAYYLKEIHKDLKNLQK